MTIGVLPEDHGWTLRVAAITKAIEDRYQSRIARATSTEAKRLKKEMNRQIQEAIDAEREKRPSSQTGHLNYWLR